MKVKVVYSKNYNYALSQNDYPIIQELVLTNDYALKKNLLFKITSESDYFYPFEQRIDSLYPRQEYQISAHNIKINNSYISQLIEKEKTNFIITIVENEVEVFKEIYEINLLVKNEWGGIFPIPEIITAFIEPNNSEVIKIIRTASNKLENLTADSSITGYQTNNKSRVWQIIASIYNSIHDLNISYSNPPASFESNGQKIRTPNEIINQGFATCLDSTLLFAACLENAGLNPIIFFKKGHSFLGVWLIENHHDTTVSNDLSFFNKSVKLEELIVIETTTLTNTELIDINKSKNIAEKYLLEDDKFINAIDINRARNVSKITPINSELKENFKTEYKEKEIKLDDIPDIEFNNFENSNETKDLNRVEIWKSKLLDLSLRNNFLNFKDTMQTLQILCPKPAELEDDLNMDKVYKIKEKVLPNIGKYRNDQIYKERTGNLYENDIIESDIKKLILHTPYTDKETNKRLLNLYRKQRLSNEETGTSTLYLAIGLFKWNETIDSERFFNSPILLVPVEIQRKSIIDGFRLKLRDEEPTINYTLLQKLETNFGIKLSGLVPLPEDDSGVDVPKIWHIFRNAVKSQPGWDIIEEVWLGHFSFKKYLMWRDLKDNEEQLRKNVIVNRILSNNQDKRIIENIEFVDENFIDTIHPSEIILPLSADSSQISAILSARDGKNMVLQGPPGTGKSQTITNLIANTLAEGKTILFVSEKKVALEVVYKRLKDIHLEPFCLELHSNKSQKGEVIKSFKNALDFAIQDIDDEWENNSNSLKQNRDYLNKYVREIHDLSEQGISVFQSIGIVSELKNEKKIDFEKLNPFDLTKFDREEISKIIRSMTNYFSELNLGEGFTWEGCNISEWNSELQSKLKIKLNSIIELNKKLELLFSKISEKLHFCKLADQNLTNLDSIVILLNLLLKNQVVPSTFLAIPQWHIVIEDLKEMIELLSEKEQYIKIIKQNFNEDFLHQDLFSLQNNLRNANNSWFLKKLINKRKILKSQKQMSKPSIKLTHQLLSDNINTGLQVKRLSRMIEEYKEIANQIFGIRWEKYESSILTEKLNWCISFRNELSKIKEHESNFDDIVEYLKKYIDDEIVQDKTIFNEFIDSYYNYPNLSNDLESLLETSFNKTTPFSMLNSKLVQMKNNINEFRFWTLIQKERSKLKNLNLDELYLSVINQHTLFQSMKKTFKYNFHRLWLKKYIDQSQTLREFSSNKHQDSINNFKTFDISHQESSKITMIQRLLDKKPKNSKMVSPSSPIAVINKESMKKRKQKSIRNFLDAVEPITPLLKPCMLMSPLSVAQYLPPKQLFDLVVFDEASQITPWDALGAMGRGKQVVVVGDSKQLPPTNLFNKEIDDDDYGDEYEDFESILDECKVHMDELTLKWHYRSKYESLIAFSNRHIYENKLNTFPSNEINEKAVSFKFLDKAVYDRGRSRTNKLEAKAIVEYIIDLIKKDLFSIGVITFNQSQRNKIEDLLSNELIKNPELDKKLSKIDSESIFIKNIENVQGDEREIILFSMTFGRDENGILTQRYSSLNRKGGHRRLNVAITRAKKQIVVFSSIRKDDIDVNKAKSRGVKLLREFLNYAEKGAKISFGEEANISPENEFDSPFEKEVYQKLIDNGWNVIPQIGVGNYRIDLGVIHPEKPGKFLAGIECDGAAYHSSKTARDRDILRQQVLENMGWKILRIWSTDWFFDSDKAYEKLENKLKQILEDINENIDKDETVENDKIKGIIQINNNQYDEPEFDSFKNDFHDYNEVILDVEGNQEGFYESYNSHIIKSQIDKVIQEEAPILRENLFQKVYKSWSLSRGGNKVNEILTSYSNSFQKSKSGKRIFYWSNNQDIENLFKLRLNNNSEKHRSPKEICPQELAHGLLIGLQHNHTISKSELFKTVNTVLGWQKKSKSSDPYFEDALKFLLQKQLITIDEDMIKILNFQPT